MQRHLHACHMHQYWYSIKYLLYTAMWSQCHFTCLSYVYNNMGEVSVINLINTPVYSTCNINKMFAIYMYCPASQE